MKPDSGEVLWPETISHGARRRAGTGVVGRQGLHHIHHRGAARVQRSEGVMGGEKGHGGFGVDQVALMINKALSFAQALF